MDNNDNEKSASQSSGGFWTILSGVLTGIGGVIGAITALLLGLKEVGIVGPTPSPSPTPPVNTFTTSSVTPIASPPTLTPTPPSPTPPVNTSTTPSVTPTATPTASPPTLTPTPPSPSQSNSRWEFMGSAITGETVSVDSSSINKSGGTINFTYKIGDEIVTARADCNDNKWYANGYEWQSPKSKTTQDMLNYVCKF